MLRAYRAYRAWVFRSLGLWAYRAYGTYRAYRV